MSTSGRRRILFICGSPHQTAMMHQIAGHVARVCDVLLDGQVWEQAL
jgi:hypothetical protein